MTIIQLRVYFFKDNYTQEASNIALHALKITIRGFCMFIENSNVY